jgi:hypothetical protein
MKLRNPFKTKKILLISPHRNIKIEVPFFGKIRYIVLGEISVETGNMKGQVFDGIIVDEVVKQKYFGKNKFGIKTYKEYQKIKESERE